jgi:hypothetical protein
MRKSSWRDSAAKSSIRRSEAGGPIGQGGKAHCPRQQSRQAVAKIYQLDKRRFFASAPIP